MQNWTDKIIHWNQLPGTEVKRLIATWGMTPEQIAKYDKKKGFVNSAPKAHVSNTTNPVDFPKAKAPAKKVTVKKTTTKVVQKVTRQKHTGADGEVKFVEHRQLYVGFFGGKVVVTKSTKEKCLEVLRKDYKLEV